MSKSRHRIPLAALEPRNDPIDDRYQAEVDAYTNRLQKAFEQAQRRVDRARVVVSQPAKWPKVSPAAALAALERAEAQLAEIVQLMQPGNHASAQHRGTRSFRPVPDQRG